MLSKADLPTSILLEMQGVPTKNEYVKCKKGFNGYKLDEKVNKWFSCALNKSVFIIRSADERVTTINPARLIYIKPEDRKKTFTTDAALHLLNLGSVRELQQRVYDRHPNDKENYFVE
jgi:uncharacterized protein YcbX